MAKLSAVSCFLNSQGTHAYTRVRAHTHQFYV